MKQLFYLSTLFFLALTLDAKAENFQLQNIRAGGLGCPNEVTQIVLAPDNTSASILFQNFESHVPILTSRGSIGINDINCNIFLDIKIPKGQKLDGIEIGFDMRGHAFLSQGVMGSFKSFLIGSNGLGAERNQGVQLIQEKLWINTGIDQEEDFTIQATKLISVPSNCHGEEREDKVSIHLQHHLASQIARGSVLMNAEGTIAMDSSDIMGGLKIRARTSLCQTQTIPGRERERRSCRVIRVNGRSQQVCF